MLRAPTDAELAVINEMAEEELTKDDCWVLDCQPANDFMETCYCYFLGTSSLLNYKTDLENTRVPMNVMHMRHIPLGNWLPGELAMLEQVPEGARPGKNMILNAPLYMPKDITMAGYNTDELVRAYQTGLMKEVSIAWRGGSLICDICHNDLRDYRKCEHIPGQMYDGVKCTFTVENSHLQFISLVDKGGLPEAKILSDGGDWNILSDGSGDWSGIKKLAMDTQLQGSLMAPIDGIKSPKGGKDEMLSYQEFKEKFTKELAAEYVLKTVHDPVVNKLAETEATVIEKDKALAAKETELTAVTKNLTDMTAKFANVNSELEAGKKAFGIGEKHLTDLTAEYNRLGVLINGDKWNEEAEKELMDKLEPDKRAELLTSKIEAMLTDPKVKDLGGQRTKEQGKELGKEKLISHMDNPDLYMVR